MTSRVNFIRQQGFRDSSAETCGFPYPALMWQPRAIGVLVLIGLFIQAWPYFVVLSALLWWNVTMPGLNPFDHLYNQLVAKPKGRLPLGRAPGPRRAPQALAGTFMLVIALCLYSGWDVLEWAAEGLLVLALVALIFGRSCVGSYLFLRLTGQAGFANKALPWKRGEYR